MCALVVCPVVRQFELLPHAIRPMSFPYAVYRIVRWTIMITVKRAQSQSGASVYPDPNPVLARALPIVTATSTVELDRAQPCAPLGGILPAHTV